MLSIPCPHCGARDRNEFSYGGDADRRPPDLSADLAGGWFDYVYIRDNPRGPHREFWQHSGGCRAWLVVNRDTVTHEILSVEAASP